MSRVSETSSSLFLLDDQKDFQTFALKLASQARRQISILSTHLDVDVFGTPEFVEVISAMAREHRQAQVQLLVKETKHLAASGHKLAKLSQRLSSKITLRKLTIAPSNTSMSFMLCDTTGLLYKNDDEFYQGFANMEAHAEVNKLREIFDYIWAYGEPEPELQTFTL